MPDKPQEWDVWFANVKFTDQPEKVKARPVVITSSGVAFLIALYVTSTPARDQYQDYTMANWQSAGLDHESTIRLDCILRLKPEDLIRKIGCLDIYDRMIIQHRMLP